MKTAVKNIRLDFHKCLHTEKDALAFLNPEGFDRLMMTDKCILVATNAAVDKWNYFNYSTPQHLINNSLETDFGKLMIQMGFSPIFLQRTF